MGTYETTMLKLEKMASANTAKQMNWQKSMSDTSHQREVKDLVAAGLNPVLSSGGSGAQSYTTSVDSAVNGIAGMASAREGANATRYAARQSAAATRAAAAAQLEAARVAAGASNYAADKHYQAQEYSSNIQREIAFEGPATNLSNLVDKFTRKAGLQDAVLNSKALKASVGVGSQLLNNPLKFFKSIEGASVTKLKQSSAGKFLNSAGMLKVGKELVKLGVSNTAAHRQLWLSAFLWNNSKAQSSLVALMPKKNSSKNFKLFKGQ